MNKSKIPNRKSQVMKNYLNNKYISFTLLVLSFALLMQPALADTSAIDLGYIGAGARPIAMGKAYTAVADDVNAVFINPAGLGQQKNWGLTSMTTKLLDRVEYKMVGGVMPTEFGTVGIGYLSAATPAGYLTTDRSSVVGAPSISYGSTMMILSYGRNLGEAISNSGDLAKVSMGANVKMISNNFQGTDGGATGTSMDLGVIYKANENVSGGVSLQNVGGAVNWNNGTSEKLPLTAKIGGALNQQRISAAADLDLGSGATLLHGGVEFRPYDVLALRAGIDQSRLSQTETITNMTYGVGVKMQGFSFDYAYRQDASLASNSASYFSISFSPVIKKAAVAEKEEVKDANAQAIASQSAGPDGVYHIVKKVQAKDILKYYE